MKSYIACYDEYGDLIKNYDVPFDVEINCHQVNVYGNKLSGMKLRGRCDKIWFNVYNFNEMDFSGFEGLEIGIMIYCGETGLLKLLELNCKKVDCVDGKLERIVNKYLKEEPLMRDIQGFKLEMAVNGYGDRL